MNLNNNIIIDTNKHNRQLIGMIILIFFRFLIYFLFRCRFSSPQINQLNSTLHQLNSTQLDSTQLNSTQHSINSDERKQSSKSTDFTHPSRNKRRQVKKAPQVGI